MSGSAGAARLFQRGLFQPAAFQIGVASPGVFQPGLFQQGVFQVTPAPRVPALEACLAAIAARLARQLPGVAVQRGRRSLIGADEFLPRLVLRMGAAQEQEGDAFQQVLLRCEAAVEGYARAPAGAADPDAALEAALAALHARCHAALVGVELPYGTQGDSLMCEGRDMQPDAPLLADAADAIGGFTWTIGFEIRAAYGAGPFIAV